MKDGQQIIFKHPDSGEIYAGFVSGAFVLFRTKTFRHLMPIDEIKEWCDAEVAFSAYGLYLLRQLKP